MKNWVAEGVASEVNDTIKQCKMEFSSYCRDVFRFENTCEILGNSQATFFKQKLHSDSSVVLLNFTKRDEFLLKSLWYFNQVFITLIRYKNNVSTVTLERVSHDGVDKTPPFQCYPCFQNR